MAAYLKLMFSFVFSLQIPWACANNEVWLCWNLWKPHSKILSRFSIKNSGAVKDQLLQRWLLSILLHSQLRHGHRSTNKEVGQVAERTKIQANKCWPWQERRTQKIWQGNNNRVHKFCSFDDTTRMYIVLVKLVMARGLYQNFI